MLAPTLHRESARARERQTQRERHFIESERVGERATGRERKREREREREKEGGMEGGRQGERERERGREKEVCMYARMTVMQHRRQQSLEENTFYSKRKHSVAKEYIL